MAAGVAGVEVDGPPVDRADEAPAVDQLRRESVASGRWDEARDPVVETSPADEHPDSLTLPAHARMP